MIGAGFPTISRRALLRLSATLPLAGAASLLEAREPQIGDDDVKGEIGQARDRGFAGIGLFDLIAAIGELLGNSLAQRRFVLAR